MLLDESVLDVLQIPLKQHLVSSHLAVRVEQDLGRGRFLEAGRPRAGEQARQKIAAIDGPLDDGLVEEVQDHVLAPDVDDERHARPERRDVREVLIGPDAKVDPVGRGALLQLGNHFLVRRLVRHEIIRTEESLGLREIDDHPPEGAVADLLSGAARR